MWLTRMEDAKRFALNALFTRRVDPTDAVMFDIDDTLLDTNTDRPIAWTVELFRLAQSLGYVCIIITARPDTPDSRMHTTLQLSHMSIFPNVISFVPASQKTERKRRLPYTIIMSFGDQWTDLGASKHYVKLPSTQDPSRYHYA